MASLTRAERETIINFNQESDLVSIYTHDQALIRQLERRGFASMRDHVYGGRVVAKTFEVPRSLLSVGLKPKRSAAQRAAAQEAGKRLAERDKAKKLLGPDALEGQGAGSNASAPGRASQ